MDFLTANAYDLSFAKSLVDYDDKNLTKAMSSAMTYVISLC